MESRKRTKRHFSQQSLDCYYTSSNEDFHSPYPPQLRIHEPIAATSHAADDEPPPNVRLGTLRNGPMTCVEGVSNGHSSNVAVSNAGEAKNGRNGTLSESGRHSTYPDYAFHPPSSPQPDIHEPAETPPLPPDGRLPDTGSERLQNSPITHVGVIYNIRLPKVTVA